MHESEFSHFDYATQYPSPLRSFHNWGLGALDNVVYAPGTFPQDWPGLGDPPFSKVRLCVSAWVSVCPPILWSSLTVLVCVFLSIAVCVCVFNKVFYVNM